MELLHLAILFWSGDINESHNTNTLQAGHPQLRLQFTSRLQDRNMKILIFIILIIIALLSSRFYYLAIKDREAVQKALEQLEELKTQDYHSQLYLPPPKMDESKMPQNGKWY